MGRRRMRPQLLVTLDLTKHGEQELRGNLTKQSVHLKLNNVGYSPVSLSYIKGITMTDIIFTLCKGHQEWNHLSAAKPNLEEGLEMEGWGSFDEWDLTHQRNGSRDEVTGLLWAFCGLSFLATAHFWHILMTGS